MAYYGDHSPRLAGSVIAIAVIAYITFGLRVYTRLTNRAWGWDDWSMAIAMLPFTALNIACVGGAFSGIGIHEYRLSDADKVTGMHYFFFFEIFYCIAIIPIKLSISFMLVRISSGRKPYTYSVYGISLMFTLMNLIALLYIIFQCRPVSFAWDTSTPGGSCNPAQTLADIYYATTAVNIFTDWFCAIIPIPLLWNVQLNRNAKISVSFILALGALASLSACIRLGYTVNLTNTDEYLYGVSDVVLWGYAENGVGVIVGCVATLRPLFRHVLNLGGNNTTPRNKLTVSYGKQSANKNTDLEGRDDDWVALTDSKAGIETDSNSEEHILGGGIKVTSTVEQRIVSRD